MRVDFVTFFLLIASPVKKENACKTAQESQIIAPAGAAPTVTTDDSVKEEYEYGHEITLKWSILDAHGYKIEFDVLFSSAGAPAFEHKDQVQCRGLPSNRCFEYRLQKLLEPGDYTWKLKFTFSKHGESIDRVISGSFTVKKPSITIISPVKDHEYQQGQDVVLKWSMSYARAKVTGFKIWAWDKKTDKAPIQCEVFINENQCKLPQLPVHSPEDTYRWTIQAVSPEGQMMKCQMDGSFRIFMAPTLDITAPKETPYEYKDRDKIIVRWAITDPKEIVRKYEILVWEKDSNKLPKMHSPKCRDIHNCDQFPLPPQEPGKYQCVVKAVSRFEMTTTSATLCAFLVEPEPGEFCGVPPIKGNLLRKKRLAFETPDGNDAVEHSWPWVGLLKIDETETDQNECIANLIQVKRNTRRSDMLVTSGGCITKWESDADDPDGGQTIEIEEKKLRVIPGIHSTTDSIEPIQIVQVRKHDKYQKTKHGHSHSHLYDVGLVRVDPPIDYDDDNHAICHPDTADPVPVRRASMFLPKENVWTCAVAGFETAVPAGTSRTLKQLSVELLASTDCKKLYKEFDGDLMMCGRPAHKLGESKKTKLTSNDNGASIHCFDLETSSSKWRMYGTVTMSAHDVERGHPFLFTRFRGDIADWVTKTADEMSLL